MRTVNVAWDPAAGSFSAHGRNEQHTITINAPGIPGEPHTATGFSPADLLLAGVGACSAWDIVEILRKGRQPLAGLTVRIEGVQEEAPPWTFRTVLVHFTIMGDVDRSAAEKAVRLSVDRYCSVIATVRGSAQIVDFVEVVPAPEPGSS